MPNWRAAPASSGRRSFAGKRDWLRAPLPRRRNQNRGETAPHVRRTRRNVAGCWLSARAHGVAARTDGLHHAPDSRYPVDQAGGAEPLPDPVAPVDVRAVRRPDRPLPNPGLLLGVAVVVMWALPCWAGLCCRGSSRLQPRRPPAAGQHAVCYPANRHSDCRCSRSETVTGCALRQHAADDLRFNVAGRIAETVLDECSAHTYAMRVWRRSKHKSPLTSRPGRSSTKPRHRGHLG